MINDLIKVLCLNKFIMFRDVFKMKTVYIIHLRLFESPYYHYSTFAILKKRFH